MTNPQEATRSRTLRRDGEAAAPARPAHRVAAAVRALAAVWLLLHVAAAFAQITVADHLGREVRLDEPAERVVSMIPSHTETVCALSACELLVGRDTFSNHPPEVLDLPDLGSAFSADVEAILALEPDLVLTDEYSGLAEALEGLDVAVYAGTPQTIEETWDVMEDIGALLGRRTEAAVLAGRSQGRLEALSRMAQDREPVTVYFELDATPYTVGPESFVGRLIAAAGGENVVPASAGEFPQIDPETVIEADPEVVILADAPYGESAATLAERPGWGDLRALREGRVIELTQEQVDLLNRAGPRLPEALELLVRLLHPELP